MQRIVPRPLLMIAAIALGTVGIALAFLIRSASGQLRACGHPRDVLWEINPFRATHCCRSGATVNDLMTLYTAQRLYHDEHGAYASSFEQLTNEFPCSLDGIKFHMEGDESNWSILVPHQSTLAGSYLLTSDGELHFSAGEEATTSDIVLNNPEAMR